MTVAPEQDGWIGRWSPGIGDPSFAGWLTVGLYVFAAWVCLQAAREIRKREEATPLSRREYWLWFAFFILLGFLGINKQLDIQTAFTELGRMMARSGDWYDGRARIQKGFIGALCAGGIVFFVALVMLIRRMGIHCKAAVLGMCFIFVFVLIRASSFHNVDEFLGSRLVHLRMNWLLEMGGISVVLLAGRGRLRALRRGPKKIVFGKFQANA